MDKLWIKLGQILHQSESNTDRIKDQFTSVLIPSLKTLEYALGVLKWRDTNKNPLVNVVGPQESVYKRLGSITDNSQQTLVLDKENRVQNHLKIDIRGSDFRFHKDMNTSEIIEGKMYVYNQNQVAGLDKQDMKTMVHKRKVLISILRFRDTLDLLQGDLNLKEMLRAKSLNFTCKIYNFSSSSANQNVTNRCRQVDHYKIRRSQTEVLQVQANLPAKSAHKVQERVDVSSLSHGPESDSATQKHVLSEATSLEHPGNPDPNPD